MTKLAKNRYKYSVRKVKRRKDHIVNRIVSSALSNKNNRLFWNEINKFKRSAKPNTASLCPTIDGLSNDLDICNTFSSKLKDILNLNDSSSCVDHLLVASSDLLAIEISPSMVSECNAKLDKNKSDGSSFSSDNLLVASTALCDFFSKLFTSILRHGYMPKLIRNCSVLPIPKPHKDPTVSDNYCPIALAPNLSKILESCILELYSNYFLASDLQFGFKKNFSTGLCTGLLKNVVSHYLHKDSKVYGCFLDASKAFDRVDHRLLFQILSDRDLPKPILKFIFSWYSSQSLTVKWKSTFSSPFRVSNGVSPILFTVYLDVLISRLVKLDIGCHLAGHFVGSLCYADDIALLAPSPSTLRMLLHQCEVFAAEFGIIFNANKTQLICFRPASAKLSLEHCNFFLRGRAFEIL